VTVVNEAILAYIFKKRLQSRDPESRDPGPFFSIPKSRNFGIDNLVHFYVMITVSSSIIATAVQSLSRRLFNSLITYVTYFLPSMHGWSYFYL
jgi:hypothetical protein